MKKINSGYIFEDNNIKTLITTREIDAKNIQDITLFLEKNNFSATNLKYLNQVHGNDVKIVDDIKCEIEDFDALVTNKKNIPLMIFTADCVPIIFYDKKKEVVALAHAGWKGTYANIVGKVIDTMLLKYGVNVEDIKVLIGPHITKNNYEVSRELIEKFSQLGFENYYEEKDDKYYLDLASINTNFLLKKGVILENIVNTNFCTVKNNDEFFSFRKEQGTKKRIGTIIEIRS